MTKAPETRRTMGFAPAARLIEGRIRAAGERRGFALSRLFTHWDEIAGPAIAAACRPLEMRYGREGMGATLTLLTTGPMAPMVEMHKPAIIDRVNACYGYRAVARLRITQTAPSGFSEGQTPFTPAPREARRKDVPAAPDERALAAAEGVQDTELRLALAALAANLRGREKR
ncbi:MAG: DUF721 domain-containing protein [Rubellimicrobium sp.]|nr:DUF721 domain-containing protein [Rubellimicrobium sp.]